jgi:carbamoyl-phosphate synthase large subunit
VIAVTGVGGGIGQSILKCLDGSGYGVVAIDPDALAAGLYAAPVAYRGPRADDPRFVDDLLDLCTREACSVLFPGIEPELFPLASNIARFRESGVVPIVSNPEVIACCDDKLATAGFLAAQGFAAPHTELFVDDVDSAWFPCVLKPRRGGARSQHTYVVADKAEFDIARALVDPTNCVIQEFIDGDEYTCGSITLEGSCRGVIVMRRTLRAGDTYKAFVVRDDGIEEHVRSVADRLQPFGACNFQLRLKNGTPYIFEINARCSGTTYARALAGFNEPRMIADYVLHGDAPEFDIREMTILRYWKELAVENDVIHEISANGSIRRDGDSL